MGIANEQTAHTIYMDYLKWFQEHARKGVMPKQEDEFVACPAFDEPSYEEDELALDRMFFLIPLSPSQSLSGRLEIFAFSELNLMTWKITENGSDDMDLLLPVEYRLE